MSSNAGQTGVADAPSAPGGAPQPTAGAAAAPQLGPPNQYHLNGGGISVSYFPQGRGPIGPAGATHFTYQDSQHALSFPVDEVRTVEVPDVGTLVSVTLVKTIDTGATTFTLIVPAVNLPQSIPASVQICTDGITTTHRVFAGLIGHTQAEAYHVTKLTGTAARGILEA